MKSKNAIFLMIAIAAIGSWGISTSAGCNNKSGDKFVRQPTDTIRTLKVYYNGYTKRDEWGPVFTLLMDTFKFVEIDTVTQQKKWVREEITFVPVSDTLRDFAGNALVDSATGKARLQTSYLPIPQSWIFRDMRLDLDSMFKKRLGDTTATGALNPPK